MKSPWTLVALGIATTFATCAWAGEADVIDAKVRRSSSSTFDFDVTVKSIDKGAGYYADAIEVLAPDGKVLGRRELLHSHEHARLLEPKRSQRRQPALLFKLLRNSGRTSV